MDADQMEKEQQNKLITGLNNLRKNKAMTDVKLKAKDGDLDAHKLILSVSSPYFNSLFNTGSKEAVDDVDVSGIKADVLETILEFMYVGSLPEDLPNNIAKVQELIVATDFLQMQNLQDYCWELLLQNLKVDNYMEPLIFAENYANEDAQNEIYKFMKENFDEINDDGQLVELSPTQMRELIIRVEDEQPAEKLVDTILTWAKHDPDMRKPELSNLFELINFDDLPDEVIHDLSNNEPLLQDSVSLLQKLLSNATSRLMKKELDMPQPDAMLPCSDLKTDSKGKTRSSSTPITPSHRTPTHVYSKSTIASAEFPTGASSKTKSPLSPPEALSVTSSRTKVTLPTGKSSKNAISTPDSSSKNKSPTPTSPVHSPHPSKSPTPVEELYLPIESLKSPSCKSPSPKSPGSESPSASAAEYDLSQTVVYHKLHFFRFTTDCPQKVKIHTYMPCNKSWFPEATLPDIISPDFIVCSVGCCLYFLSSYYQCVILYYPTNGRFKQLTTTCPIASCVRVVEHRNKIYIWNEDCFIRFNPGLKRWESLAPYRGDFSSCFFISTSASLFIRNCAEKALYCYNIFANQWYLKTIQQSINCTSSCAPYEGRLYFCSGNRGEMQIYDPAVNRWDTMKLPEEMSELGKNWSHLSVSQEWPFLLFQDENENLWQYTPLTKVLEKFADPYDRDISDWNRCVLTVEMCKTSDA